MGGHLPLKDFCFFRYCTLHVTSTLLLHTLLQVIYLYKTFVFRKGKDPKYTDGTDKWRPSVKGHRPVLVEDIQVLTPDCSPEAQGYRQ
jgi:hypothetical protein